MDKQDIENRLLYNKLILKVIEKEIEQHPELRFMQILHNLGIIEDSFYEESVKTFEKLKENNDLANLATDLNDEYSERNILVSQLKNLLELNDDSTSIFTAIKSLQKEIIDLREQCFYDYKQKYEDAVNEIKQNEEVIARLQIRNIENLREHEKPIRNLKEEFTEEKNSIGLNDIEKQLLKLLIEKVTK